MKYSTEEKSLEVLLDIRDLLSLPQIEALGKVGGEGGWGGVRVLEITQRSGCRKVCTNGVDTYHDFNMREHGSCADSSCKEYIPQGERYMELPSATGVTFANKTSNLPQEKLNIEALLQDFVEAHEEWDGFQESKSAKRMREIIETLKEATKDPCSLCHQKSCDGSRHVQI